MAVGGSHICRKSRVGGIPYLHKNLDCEGDPIPTGSQMWDPHICRKPRWGDPISAGNQDGGIPYLQET